MKRKMPSTMPSLFDKVVMRIVHWPIRILLEGRKVRKQEYRVQEILWDRAAKDSADFIENHIKDVLVFDGKIAMWDYTISKIKEQKIDGVCDDVCDDVCLEFGVYKGDSINYFSQHLQESEFVGFDSFEGLAEDWKGHPRRKGAFSLGGRLPNVRSNVTLVKGWFDQTLPEYCAKHLGKKSVRFVHMDSDTYESSAMVLEQMAKYFRPGLLVLFDELIGYPNWRNGEFRAWQEVSKKHKIQFRYLGFSSEQALIEIID